MQYFREFSAAFLGFGVALVQIQAAQALTNTEIKNIAQSITVQIQAAQNPKDHGSGVIMRRDGQTYIVLTARHVVEAAKDFEVKTPDGEIYPIKQESIRYLPNVDLALLKFNSTRSYSIAKMGDTNQSQPGSASFVAGFTEKDFYFDVGKINVNANGSLANGYTLGLDNFILSGMSGGPVLNEAGRLIGINGLARDSVQKNNLRQSHINKPSRISGSSYAVSINTFLRLVPQIKNSLPFSIPNTLLSQSTKGYDSFSQGILKKKRGDFKGAILDFTKYIRSHPNDALVYDERGSTFGQSGDYKSAISDYDQAIRLVQNDPTLYYNRGKVHEESGDYKSAITDYNQAIQLEPNYTSAYVNRGNTHRELKEYKSAISDYNQAIQLSPDDADIYTNRGASRAESGDYNGSINDYNRAVQLSPSNAIIYYNRGNAQRELGNYKEAIKDYDQAIHLDPKYTLAYTNCGVLHAKLGDHKNAFNYLNQAILLDPSKPESYVNRGITRFESGDTQGTLMDFSKAADLARQQNNQSLYDQIQSNIQKLKS